MPKLTAMMIVRNEGQRYLRRSLEHLTAMVDEIIILDDASTDETPEICVSYPTVKLYKRDMSMFLNDEAFLRQELWKYTRENKPEWILALDADEFLEQGFIKELPYLLNQKLFSAVSFRLFDCWNSEDYYRADGLWNPWARGFSVYMVKYRPQLGEQWPPLKFHCGRLPLAYRKILAYESSIRIKHLGWANPLEQKYKYERAVAKDPDFIYMSRDHYESILWPSERIILKEWVEQV